MEVRKEGKHRNTRWRWSSSSWCWCCSNENNCTHNNNDEHFFPLSACPFGRMWWPFCLISVFFCICLISCIERKLHFLQDTHAIKQDKMEGRHCQWDYFLVLRHLQETRRNCRECLRFCVLFIIVSCPGNNSIFSKKNNSLKEKKKSVEDYSSHS